MSSTLDRRSFLTSLSRHSRWRRHGRDCRGLHALERLRGRPSGLARESPRSVASSTVGTSLTCRNYHIFNGFARQDGRLGFLRRERTVRSAIRHVCKRQNGVADARAVREAERQLHGVDDRASTRLSSSTTAPTLTRPSVVANYTAAAADTTVGLAIAPFRCFGQGSQLLHRRIQHGHSVRIVPGAAR